MSKFPNTSDDKLVAFLRQNCPVPPDEAIDLEEQLMAKIEKQPLKGASPYLFFDSIRHAKIVLLAAASLLLTWSGYRLFMPSPRIATYGDELESFVVNSWNGSVGDPSFVTQTESMEVEWLLINNQMETTPSFYNP